jgi:hypothetical protein
LRALVSNPYATVRAHVAWALGRIGSDAARDGLSEALPQEPDAEVQDEIRAALASYPSSS